MSKKASRSNESFSEQTFPSDEEILGRSLKWSELLDKIKENAADEDVENNLGPEEFEDFMKKFGEECESDLPEAKESNEVCEEEENDDDEELNQTINATIREQKTKIQEWQESGMDKVLDSFCVKDIEAIVGPWVRNRSMIDTSLNIPSTKNRSKTNKVTKVYKRKSSHQMFSPIPEKDSGSEYSDDSVEEARYIKSIPKKKPISSSDYIVREYILKNHGQFYQIIKGDEQKLNSDEIFNVVSTLKSVQSKSMDVPKTPKSGQKCSKFQTEKISRMKPNIRKKSQSFIVDSSDSEDDQQQTQISFHPESVINSTTKHGQNVTDITFDPDHIINSTTRQSSVSRKSFSDRTLSQSPLKTSDLTLKNSRKSISSNRTSEASCSSNSSSSSTIVGRTLADISITKDAMTSQNLSKVGKELSSTQKSMNGTPNSNVGRELSSTHKGFMTPRNSSKVGRELSYVHNLLNDTPSNKVGRELSSAQKSLSETPNSKVGRELSSSQKSVNEIMTPRNSSKVGRELSSTQKSQTEFKTPHSSRVGEELSSTKVEKESFTRKSEASVDLNSNTTFMSPKSRTVMNNIVNTAKKQLNKTGELPPFLGKLESIVIGSLTKKYIVIYDSDNPEDREVFSNCIKNGKVELNAEMIEKFIGQAYFGKLMKTYHREEPFKKSCSENSKLVYYLPTITTDDDEDSSDEEDDPVYYKETFGYLAEL